jgi:hypothetical protein
MSAARHNFAPRPAPSPEKLARTVNRPARTVVISSEFNPLGETALFIELVGASGARYRFRKVDGHLPPIGGNFVCVRTERGGGSRVVGCGKARTLARALAEEIHQVGPKGDLYVRLNVSGALRDSEHEDLVAALPQPLAVYVSD